MPQRYILFPVLVQVLLTVTVLVLMGRARGRSLKASGKSVADRDVALGEVRWSDEAIKRSNNYDNQFQLPVLFYAASAFALVLRAVDPWMLGLASLFALSRIAHTIIHIGANRVPARGASFIVGLGAVLAMWLMLGWRAAQGSS